MTADYVIFFARDAAWAERAAAFVEQNSSLSTVVRNRRLIVLVGPDTGRIVMRGSGSAVIGSLFTREAKPTRVVDIDDRRAGEIVASRGHLLVSEYWGGYVAVIGDQDAEVFRVIRDPSAEMPCWYLDRPEGIVVGSDVESLLAAGSVEPEINWSYLTQVLLGRNMPSIDTGLVGVRELLAGHELVLDHTPSRVRPCWSPWEHAAGERSISPSIAEQAEQVRETVVGCVGASASRFDHVLLSVSGGLDSSIVAAALSEADRSFSCFTQSTRDAAGDERGYARLLAENLGVKLTEVFFEPGRIDVQTSHTAHLPRPVGHKLGQETIRAAREIGLADRAGGYFSGVGGDNVFCSIRSASAIADRAIVEGWGVGVLKSLLDVCELTDCSVWDAAGRAWGKYAARDRSYPRRRITRYMSSAAITETGEWARHPWLDAPRALPGKMFHVALCLIPQNLLGAWPRDLAYCPPLLAQPIVERCLGIPTWRWCDAGADRAVARLAFADLLPPKIIKRKLKGTPSAASVEVFETNRPLLREALVEGHLTRMGIIDRHAVEKALSDPRATPEAYNRVMQFADVEAWTRSWIFRRPALQWPA
ncbi:asparagine synthase-related protein (plasmid) [Brevundimonas staleyi]|uniref:asparagine synthase (glutamine-hydrolyzing) n=1 Tax=Brevundimonas staleyi TaxID=74326 RepID=A0ABW0FNX7_9CAUL